MLRRISLGVLLFVLVGGAIVYLLRGPIALRLVRSAVETNMRADFIGELPDGLHVTLCGAGGPLPDPARSGPCVAIVAGRDLYVVDAGTGGGRNMGPLGLPAGRIEALFLTHFHSDHIDGLGELALLRWVGGTRTEPLPVVGPQGVEAVVAGFNESYAADHVYRTAHHGAATVPPSGAGMVARPFATPPGTEALVVWEANGLRVSSFRVEHEPVRPAVGYRFDYGGRSVLVSGDTIATESVRKHAQGVDLLVHEALSARLVGMMNEAATAAGRTNLAKITLDIPDYHTTPVEVAEIAQKAGAGHLLYYHIVPPLPVPGLDSVFLEGVSEVYSGPVTLGIDGTMISLPRDSEVIDVVRR